MNRKEIHTLILGAGPSGLTAGYTLAKAGKKPVLIEKAKFAGGLMSSLKHGDFIMDVGRKELYNRIEKIDKFWNELLGDNYREYEHRGGILYKGKIIDALPNYQGFRRGMPWGMFIGTCFNFLYWRLRLGLPKPTNIQDQFYQQRGENLTRIFSQGFQEKLTGRKWSETPIPQSEDSEDVKRTSFIETLSEALKRTFSKTEPNNFEGEWKHPVKGTGQICQLLEEGIAVNGGEIEFGSQITAIETGNDKILEVSVEVEGETIVYVPENVVTSIPIEFLLGLLMPEKYGVSSNRKLIKRNTVILVYLFLDEPPQFPQVYLHVTCPSTRMGRITNYAAFGGEMVPEGKTCLCCELYSFDQGDDLLKLNDEELARKVLVECEESGLLHSNKFTGAKVLRLPGADASQNRDNWMNQERLQLMEEIKRFKNVYYTNRTELDFANLAGIEAAEAILSGERADFDRRIDPAELGIRSKSKSFSFA